jgi:hypothetical protein
LISHNYMTMLVIIYKQNTSRPLISHNYMTMLVIIYKQNTSAAIFKLLQRL